MSNGTKLVRVAIVGAGSGVAPRHFESFVPSVGAEVVAEGRKVLDRVGQVFGHTFRFEEAPIGWAAIRRLAGVD